VFGILLFGLYHSSLAWLVTHDWAKAVNSYSYLIPFVILYLAWEQWATVARAPVHPSWKGLIPFLAGILLFFLGELSGEFYSLYISFWCVLVGILLLHFGWSKLRPLAFPLFFSLTMFPLPDFLYNTMSLKLKILSSMLGVKIIQLCGLSAYREGNIIDLGFTQLQVVEACSGLRYFVSLLVFSIVLAYFLKAPFWKRVILVASSVPIAVITNSLRIASVAVLYKYWGAAVAEGFFHDFSGWFIFVFALALLLAVMGILNRLGPRRRLVKAEKRIPLAAGSGSDKITSKKDKASLPGLPKFIVSVVLLAATLALAQGVEFREKIPISKALDHFPLQVGEWYGLRGSIEQKFIDSLDLSDYVIIDYHDEKGRAINLYVAYYESQRKGEAIHSPATCLPGSGWIEDEKGAVSFSLSSDSSKKMAVNRTIIQKNNGRQLAYYWFSQQGRVLTNAYQLKFYTFWGALTRQRTDGALVRLLTPVYENESISEADTRLQSFAGKIFLLLEDFIPE
jgi:exosortase D (VPLPA-CTERM-specific)